MFYLLAKCNRHTLAERGKDGLQRHPFVGDGIGRRERRLPCHHPTKEKKKGSPNEFRG